MPFAGFDDFREVYNPANAIIRMGNDLCQVCGSEITGGGEKYCSRECTTKGITKDKVEKTCPNCEKEFEMYPSDAKRGRRYCSHECSVEHYEYARGEEHHLYNRTTSECEMCGDEFEHIPSKDRSFCSYECVGEWCSKYRDYPTGPDNPNWEGGTGRITQSQRWKNLRDEMVERDNGRCQECGFDENLHVHHIQPLSEGGDPYNPDNLKTLCKTCHRAKHFS